jgi:hypothetical protein
VNQTTSAGKLLCLVDKKLDECNGASLRLGSCRPETISSDVTQHLSTDGINLAIGPEEAYRPLYLLKGLDRRVEQDTIKATIHTTDVILMVFVEGVHGILQRGQIPGAYSTERLPVLRGPEFRLPYPSGISRAEPLPS